ncbi:uncharacterized protein LOC110025213 isoform X2 [Phalaenopsis equestris]|uniref:uncharacterized protein LOC110025213 isoform X2 n=1 Tax=Phalaenopsis equestris TaxID=78828 RepID=UPI0009E2B75B|nr:uncharacterized protein LOC110025213 isoform X2 [Phalaenopsis equestris]
MAIAAIFSSAVLSSLILSAILSAETDGLRVSVGAAKVSNSFPIGGRNLVPVSDGILNFAPLASGPAAMAPDAGVLLVLAAKRTRRPDVLNKFRHYRGGWDITNRHYWASVGFTGAAGFILALIWFLSFAFALAVFHCCDWRMTIKEKSSERSQQWFYLLFLLLFTCTASIGCIVLCVAQDEFHDEASNTLSFVVQQSDFIVQILRNVTDYLSLAKTISVDEFYISSDAQNEINKLDVDLRSAAHIISEKTTENSEKIRRAVNYVRDVLILVAVIMLLLALIGFGHKRAIYVFTTAGWLLVAVTLFLFGVFVILKSTVGDTCTAMNEWAHYPHTESALSNILPCIDPKTTDRTLFQSKIVVLQLVSVVNSVIRSTANSNHSTSQSSNHFNQSGPVMPLLCSPYDSKLEPRYCRSNEVSFSNASLVWKDYICAVSESGSCTGFGRITPNVYLQLVVAVNASYALEHYTPLLLNLQDCKFVRESFNTITSDYCNYLERDLSMVNTGLLLISIGVILCLLFWILYTNRRRQELSVTLSEALQVTSLPS